jgi:hypothetical protein
VKLDAAKSTAMGMTSRFGAAFAVYRLSGWTADEYGVRKRDELPAEAEIAAVFTVSAAAAPASPPEGGQGSLFE